MLFTRQKTAGLNAHLGPGLIVLLGFALIGSLTAGCKSSGQATPEAPAPTAAERLQLALERAVTDGLPAAALAVRGDNFSFSGVAGVEDVATAIPLSNDHRFYLASVGKTYSAVAAVRMAADGALVLDDPITRWLLASVTDRIPSSASITIRSLLNHTSGLFDFHNDDDTWNSEFLFGDPARHWTNADVLPYLFDKPLHFEPTTDYRYSDSNYVLAALILEAASGLSIQDIVRYHIIEPLGLQNTVHGHEAIGLPGFVHGYVEYEEEILDVYPLYSHYGLSDGGIQASAADLANFFHTVLTTDAILDAAARDVLQTPSSVGDQPSRVALGLAIDVGRTSEHVTYFNDGKDVGFRADVHHLTFSDQRLTVAICASASLGDYDVWYEDLKQAVFEILDDAALTPGT